MRKLSAEPEVAARFGQAARQRFESLFTARQMASSYAAQYEALLKQRR